MIAPGSWLGLLGGGQLGRMFCMAAQRMGYRVVVLEPDHASPAGALADRHLRMDYLDVSGLAELAVLARAATTEFENVPAGSLAYLGPRVRVAPTAHSVSIAQDRILEKRFLADHGFPLAPFAVLRSTSDARSVDAALLPGIVKRARSGYDGKGQIRVATAAAVPAAHAALDGAPCVLEHFIPLACEVSVLVARNDRGHAVTWDVAENRHRDGILDTTIVPARVHADVAAQARRIALDIAARLDYCGVLCVEFFVQDDGALLVNEIAPRPHNSGHHTIDASVTSQFEQQVRVLADLPLGDTSQHSPAVMVNLLGDIWFADEGTDVAREPDWRAVLAEPQAKLHLYGKAEPRRRRKMGHITCIAPTLPAAIDIAGRIRHALGMPLDHAP